MVSSFSTIPTTTIANAKNGFPHGTPRFVPAPKSSTPTSERHHRENIRKKKPKRKNISEHPICDPTVPSSSSSPSSWIPNPTASFFFFLFRYIPTQSCRFAVVRCCSTTLCVQRAPPLPGPASPVTTFCALRVFGRFRLSPPSSFPRGTNFAGSPTSFGFAGDLYRCCNHSFRTENRFHPMVACSRVCRLVEGICTKCSVGIVGCSANANKRFLQN